MPIHPAPPMSQLTRRNAAAQLARLARSLKTQMHTARVMRQQVWDQLRLQQNEIATCRRRLLLSQQRVQEMQEFLGGVLHDIAQLECEHCEQYQEYQEEMQEVCDDIQMEQEYQQKARTKLHNCQLFKRKLECEERHCRLVLRQILNRQRLVVATAIRMGLVKDIPVGKKARLAG